MNIFKKIFCKKEETKKHFQISKKVVSSPLAETELPPTCPSCQKELEQKPQRKKKCPHCSNYIFVKRRPTSETKELVTEQEAKLIEEEWNKIHSHNALLRELEEYGFTEEEFIRKKNSFDGPVPNKDIIWSLFNEALDTNARKGDKDKLQWLYYQKATFLAKEGKNPNKLLRESKKYELLGYQQQGVSFVRVSFSGNGCESCKKIEGKKYAIAEALEKMPLPHEGCTMDVFETGVSWCRCIYLTEFE